MGAASSEPQEGTPWSAVYRAAAAILPGASQSLAKKASLATERQLSVRNRPEPERQGRARPRLARGDPSAQHRRGRPSYPSSLSRSWGALDRSHATEMAWLTLREYTGYAAIRLLRLT